MLECVVNISEGRSRSALKELSRVTSPHLLDVHSDPHHNRSVFTLAGDGVEVAVRSLARRAIELLDLSAHAGVHPRIGVVDVVPFVALEGSSEQEALAARDDFARWLGWEMGVPAFLYGPERSLPEVRRHAFDSLAPEHGPARPHDTAGAAAVGCRPVLVAYNLWVEADLDAAKALAKAIRSPSVRALGMQVGERVQVSCNLIDPVHFGPADLYDAVAHDLTVVSTELVGLLPEAVLSRQPRDRWQQLDLTREKTIEARLEEHGLR